MSPIQWEMLEFRDLDPRYPVSGRTALRTELNCVLIESKAKPEPQSKTVHRIETNLKFSQTSISK